MVHTFKARCSLWGIFWGIFPPSHPFPDQIAGQDLLLNMTTKINEEMLNGEVEKEWRQMGIFRNNKKCHCLLIFVVLSNMCRYIYVCLITSHILLIFAELSFWHRSIHIWAASSTSETGGQAQ